MNIRPATLADLPRLMVIYREARQIQLDSGNLHQWREGYPTEEVVRQDIARGVSYVIEAGAGDDGTIVGAFAFIPGVDPTYLYIEGGAWIDDTQPYAVIHRLAKTPSVHGIFDLCIDWCWERCQNLRIDTHEDNAIMRHCIEKAGFKYCGVIYLMNGDPRLAYQKI